MSNTNGLVALGLAFVLVILIPSVVYPLFYVLFSSYLGCSSIGSINSMFSFNLFSKPSVSVVCPSNSNNIYIGLLIYTLILVVVISLFMARIDGYISLVVIGAFFPSLIFFIQKLVNINLFNYQMSLIISIPLMLLGGLIAWKKNWFM